MSGHHDKKHSAGISGSLPGNVVSSSDDDGQATRTRGPPEGLTDVGKSDEERQAKDKYSIENDGPYLVEDL